MAKALLTITSLYCSNCNSLNYTTRRRKELLAKLELSKFCNHPNCRKHTPHRGKDAK